MSHLIIDAHAHLWKDLNGEADGYEVRNLGGGKASFMGEVRQMMPPYIKDGKNTAEIFVSNMDYDRVAGAVITQEFIDGNQNEYLLEVKQKYPDRFKICGIAEFRKPDFFEEIKNICNNRMYDCIKVPAQRLVNLQNRVYLTDKEMLRTFEIMEDKGLILSIDLAEGDTQVREMKEVISLFPRLKIAIGHFGMVTSDGWEKQIELAQNENVMVESGGITWLFHNEFYPYAGAVKAIRKAIDIAGIDKLMWGSDYPRTMTAITYRMSFDFILKSDGLNEEQKCKFLGENAKHFYGFKNLVIPDYIKNMVE
jgi:predicted TIM-barrel fold metal-dependent hydrolase